MELTYLKGNNDVIPDDLSQFSPLEPELTDKEHFYAIPVHHIMLEISATESQLDRIKVAMQTD